MSSFPSFKPQGTQGEFTQLLNRARGGHVQAGHLESALPHVGVTPPVDKSPPNSRYWGNGEQEDGGVRGKQQEGTARPTL